jgi:hypothetical protein
MKINKNYLNPLKVVQSFRMWYAAGREDKRCPEIKAPPKGASRHPVAVLAYWLGGF